MCRKCSEGQKTCLSPRKKQAPKHTCSKQPKKCNSRNLTNKQPCRSQPVTYSCPNRHPCRKPVVKHPRYCNAFFNFHADYREQLQSPVPACVSAQLAAKIWARLADNDKRRYIVEAEQARCKCTLISNDRHANRFIKLLRMSYGDEPKQEDPLCSLAKLEKAVKFMQHWKSEILESLCDEEGEGFEEKVEECVDMKEQQPSNEGVCGDDPVRV